MTALEREELRRGIRAKMDALPPKYREALSLYYTGGYSIAEAGHARLTVYNLAGQAVRTLADAWHLPGEHRVTWDGRDAAGRASASGIYIYRLTSEHGTLVGRMTLVR